MTYIFYDTETTGKSTSFDQILQFASIKTDSELNILDTFKVPLTNMRAQFVSRFAKANGTYR